MTDGIPPTGCAIIVLLSMLLWAVLIVVGLVIAHALGITVWVPA